MRIPRGAVTSVLKYDIVVSKLEIPGFRHLSAEETLTPNPRLGLTDNFYAE